MNITQIEKVSSKHEKYYQGVYPIDILQSTLIKTSIFAIKLDKNYMPDSHLVAVCISESRYAESFDSFGQPHYKFEIMALLKRHLISWNSTATDYRDSLRNMRTLMLQIRPPQNQGKKG